MRTPSNSRTPPAHPTRAFFLLALAAVAIALCTMDPYKMPTAQQHVCTMPSSKALWSRVARLPALRNPHATQGGPSHATSVPPHQKPCCSSRCSCRRMCQAYSSISACTAHTADPSAAAAVRAGLQGTTTCCFPIAAGALLPLLAGPRQTQLTASCRREVAMLLRRLAPPNSAPPPHARACCTHACRGKQSRVLHSQH
jgi:hypothetical protein